MEAEENFIESLFVSLLLFWWQKIAFKSLFDLHLILLICVAAVSCMVGEGFSHFPVRDWEGVCSKLLPLVFLNFQILSKMLTFLFIEVTWKLGYLRWLSFVQENWLRGHASCLNWKWLICFSIWCQTIPQKMWVSRFQDLQLLWLRGHSWSQIITTFWGSKQVLYVRKT